VAYVSEHFHPELEAQKYVVFVDATRRYTDCSVDVSSLVGYDRAELLNMKIDDLSFDNFCVPHLFERYLREARQHGEYILRHKNGSPILIRYRAWVFDDGCLAATWVPAEEWEQLYLQALLETSPVQLKAKVNAAMSAIQKRRSSLSVGDSPEISQKLNDAYEALRAIFVL